MWCQKKIIFQLCFTVLFTQFDHPVCLVATFFIECVRKCYCMRAAALPHLVCCMSIPRLQHKKTTDLSYSYATLLRCSKSALMRIHASHLLENVSETESCGYFSINSANYYLTTWGCYVCVRPSRCVSSPPTTRILPVVGKSPTFLISDWLAWLTSS